MAYWTGSSAYCPYSNRTLFYARSQLCPEREGKLNWAAMKDPDFAKLIGIVEIGETYMPAKIRIAIESKEVDALN